jgi:uncharacterized protein YciI
MDKKYFFLKLNPPRASFGTDMTMEERFIMQQHIAYWLPYVDEGTIVVQGPVFDPNGMYGIAVAAVDSQETLEHLIANDPANGMSSYEFYPMSAAVKMP